MCVTFSMIILSICEAVAEKEKREELIKGYQSALNSGISSKEQTSYQEKLEKTTEQHKAWEERSQNVADVLASIETEIESVYGRKIKLSMTPSQHSTNLQKKLIQMSYRRRSNAMHSNVKRSCSRFGTIPQNPRENLIYFVTRFPTASYHTKIWIDPRFRPCQTL